MEKILNGLILGLTLESLLNLTPLSTVASMKRSNLSIGAPTAYSEEGKSDENVMLQLLEAHCLPILTYSIDVIHVANRDERRRMRVAYNSIFRNSIFRKTFEYRQWESVTALQHALHRPTWEELVNARRETFRNKISENSSTDERRSAVRVRFL